MHSALRCAPRRLCLLLLLVFLLPLLVTQKAATVTLHTRDRLDSLEPSTGGEFYQVQDSNRYCRKCPEGTHVAEHCEEQYGFSKCSPCKANEFIEYPNDFLKCLGCRMCREDQVELSPCRADRDTQCACRNGTFCSPDHPCEMCQKCRPRCSNNEVELAPCTPHSDRQCGPPTSTVGFSNALITTFVVVVVVVVLAVLVVRLRCCRRPPGEGRDLSGKSCSKMMRWLRQRRDPARQDNRHNEQLSRNQLLPGAPRVEKEVMLRTSHPSEQPRRNLVPVPGIEPHNALRCSFDTFAEAVLCQDWRRFARALGLLENEISCAEMMNNRYSRESFFQMLNTWLNKEGMNASVNRLLDTLHELNLRGTAEEISSRLVQKGVFQYESS